jgi:DoxX-like family
VETTIQTKGAAERLSKAAERTGYMLSGVAVLFLIFDTAIKLAGMQQVADAMVQLGYPVAVGTTIGLIELVCLVAYLVPRTSVWGVILITGYLGGAIATHLRVGSPLATHVLFPIYVALLLWGGLYLRDARVRTLVRF